MAFDLCLVFAFIKRLFSPQKINQEVKLLWFKKNNVNEFAHVTDKIMWRILGV